VKVGEDAEVGAAKTGLTTEAEATLGDSTACTDSSVMIHVLPMRLAGISPALSHL
jgi:hypothetical protein